MVVPEVIRSRRRSIGLEITCDARLVVRAPYGTAHDAIFRVVEGKREWITAKLEQARQRFPRSRPKEFIDGERFLYLGDEYPLRLTDEQDVPLLFGRGFSLARRYACVGRRLFTAWYMAHAQRIFSGRASVFGRHSGVALSDAATRWGCCTPAGNIYLNWRLVMAPSAVIDYVIAHEAAHLERRDHSRRFWRKVESLYPGYAGQRKWLKENGDRLVL